MSVRCRSWLPGLLLAACASTEPPREPSPAPAQSPVVPEEPESPESPEPEVVERRAVVQALAWRWKSPEPVGGQEAWVSMPTRIDNGPVSVRAFNLGSSGVDVVQSREGSVDWTTTIGEEYFDAAALAWAGDVLVAHFHSIASGAGVTRLDGQTGRPVWTRPLQGLGPVGHSKYRSAVQIEVWGGEVFVFGRESQGAYVEVLDLEDGHRLRHSLVEPGLVDLEWREVPEPPAPSGFSLPPSWSITGDAPPLLRHEAGVGPGTSILLPRGFGECDTGAGIVNDGVLYLVHACSITSGARLYALGVGETAWRWQTDLYAVGPIAHSAYSNRVDLEWKDGRVVVYGDEAMGRYLEVVEPKTGKTLVNKRWPR